MKRTNGILIVGQLNGRRKIRWEAAFLLGCALGIFGSGIATAFYFILAGQPSWLAAILGFVLPFNIVGIGIKQGCQLPVEQLKQL